MKGSKFVCFLFYNNSACRDFRVSTVIPGKSSRNWIHDSLGKLQTQVQIGSQKEIIIQL